MKDDNILEYHLNKIKEDVAQLIAIKFDAEFGQKELFVFDLDKKKQVQNLYDWIGGGKFLIGDDSKVLFDYL